ncbi:MAG: ParB-like nuclease domain-containing protein [Anaerolineae bacterium]|nr:MAG: ParB-like nuclease domain-containing protein [Anaerolineae bacterium]
MLGKSEAQQVRIMDLRPNNWYINQAKLDKVREAWQSGTQDLIPPVLVTVIDGSLSLIDGHARTYAAYERGETYIVALISDLEQIEGSTALYRHIHQEGPRIGIETIADLKNRIVGPQDHMRLWVGYCTKWLEEHDQEAC